MNNEEKILAILEAMQTEQKVTNDRLARLEAGQAKLEDRLDTLETGQRRIRKDIKEIQLELSKGLWKEILRLDDRIDRVANQ